MEVERQTLVYISAGVLFLVSMIAAQEITPSGFEKKQPVKEPGEDGVIYDIDTKKEWKQEAGHFWTKDAVSFDKGRVGISRYGKWRHPNGFNSSVNYRTVMVDFTKDPAKLDRLEATGHIGRNSSALGLRVFDCSERLEISSTENVTDAESCHPNTGYGYGLPGKNYSYPTHTGKGDVVIDRDFRNITVDGYVMIELMVAARKSTEIPEEESSYWDSVKLTYRPIG